MHNDRMTMTFFLWSKDEKKITEFDMSAQRNFAFDFFYVIFQFS
jgi:hypothetical protein